MRLGEANRSVLQRFEELHRTAVAPGALDTKTKELIALAVSITQGCDDCIAHHAHDAIGAGASGDELVETLGVAVLMGGGPGMVHASHAIDAVDQFLDAKRQ